MIAFLGDSITQWWDAEYFNHYFGMYKTINLGVSGQTSSQTIEYLKLTKFNNFKPSKVVLQIGTNDSDHNISTGQTVANIKKICKMLLEKSPDITILLVGPLPRGETPSDRHRIYNREVNKLLRYVMYDTRVLYIDIGTMFMRVDGIISRNIMYDYLHLTKQGYIILSEIVYKHLFALDEPSGLLATPSPLPRLS